MRIGKFIEDWDNKDSLTIYVYLGHASLAPGNNKKSKYLIGLVLIPESLYKV
jgi:hypothetical protein